MSKVHYIPKGYNSITPYLVVKDAARAIEYYKNVFGATVVVRMDGPDGKVGHAELQIGDSRFMLADEKVDARRLKPDFSYSAALVKSRSGHLSDLTEHRKEISKHAFCRQSISQFRAS